MSSGDVSSHRSLSGIVKESSPVDVIVVARSVSVRSWVNVARSDLTDLRAVAISARSASNWTAVSLSLGSLPAVACATCAVPASVLGGAPGLAASEPSANAAAASDLVQVFTCARRCSADERLVP